MAIFGLRTSALEPTNYYSAPDTCQAGGYVIVSTENGLTAAKIVSGPLPGLPGFSEDDLPQIDRPANEEDLKVHVKNLELAKKAREFCKDCIKFRKLDMKLVDVEIFFDRSKYIFYFTAPSRIDFRELVKDLVREYRARIELRQIGIRHETQMLGAIGNCGMVCCCRRHLRKFAPVTIKMAKEQNLFLNPTKISGICGRLLCCLSYEQENYENFHQESPRCGKKYSLSSHGHVKVVRTSMFKNTVSFVNEKNEESEISLEEWKKLNPARLNQEPFNQRENQDDDADPDCGQ